MKIEGQMNNRVLSVILEGRLDTDAAPLLEEFLTENLPGAESVELDFSGVDYISSAGLRVMVWLSRHTGISKGFIRIRNMKSSVKGIFELTGISDMVVVE
ncbi:MAG: STAS domain-containing protein [Ruminiclostridium sp.]|nr:STAS domain-containing protein [Ruminiclostridium sp.]